MQAISISGRNPLGNPLHRVPEELGLAGELVYLLPREGRFLLVLKRLVGPDYLPAVFYVRALEALLQEEDPQELGDVPRDKHDLPFGCQGGLGRLQAARVYIVEHLILHGLYLPYLALYAHELPEEHLLRAGHQTFPYVYPYDLHHVQAVKEDIPVPYGHEQLGIILHHVPEERLHEEDLRLPGLVPFLEVLDGLPGRPLRGQDMQGVLVQPERFYIAPERFFLAHFSPFLISYAFEITCCSRLGRSLFSIPRMEPLTLM